MAFPGIERAGIHCNRFSGLPADEPWQNDWQKHRGVPLQLPGAHYQDWNPERKWEPVLLRPREHELLRRHYPLRSIAEFFQFPLETGIHCACGRTEWLEQLPDPCLEPGQDPDQSDRDTGWPGFRIVLQRLRESGSGA